MEKERAAGTAAHFLRAKLSPLKCGKDATVVKHVESSRSEKR